MIPEYTSATKPPKGKLVVPRRILQTWKSRDLTPAMEANVRRWIEMNPSFEHHFFDDASCVAFIGQHFGGRAVAAYDQLPPGAFRADLWRYCALYTLGGVYADVDMVCLRSLESAIGPRDTFVVPHGSLNRRFLYNAFIASTPQHRLLGELIDRACRVLVDGEVMPGSEQARELFSSVFHRGEQTAAASWERTFTAFSTVGPLGLARSVNTSLGLPGLDPFQPGRRRVAGVDIRILRFNRRCGVLAGWRPLLKARYEGYLTGDNGGAPHWTSGLS